MTAGEICIREVAIATRKETLMEASKRMREYHVGNLVVVEEKEGERIPIGILTDRDIVVGVMANAPDYIGSLTVEDVMTPEPVTALENDDIAEVLKKMRSRGFRRIPVVNAKGGLEGILTLDDVLEQIWEQLTDMVTIISREQNLEKERRA
ncbi:CBS domain-containing protein [Desulforhabdus amnigena]|jgi:CBS domain-containing protein|uniref:CBS domain-containing protein n=1 Tax=Desulforhabdus amnigena TaxID=40218 RepID=A0A9W6D2G5_9BACT|nr:CBS domain-containing protein [Desulforhabdus amnigena]NLJ27728.1 CBS domain-containing protein [Deltaproteobacteria bacterium]GLI32980.1 CBS domain-containing protein [Desulforhabdus amnigena]